jgi:hypothetical protein
MPELQIMKTSAGSFEAKNRLFCNPTRPSIGKPPQPSFDTIFAKLGLYEPHQIAKTW